jgi:hypothetical protein
MSVVQRRPSPLYELFDNISEMTPAEFDACVAKINDFDPRDVPCDSELSDS